MLTKINYLSTSISNYYRFYTWQKLIIAISTHAKKILQMEYSLFVFLHHVPLTHFISRFSTFSFMCDSCRIWR